MDRPKTVTVRVLHVWDCPHCRRVNTLEISLDHTDACYWCKEVVSPDRGGTYVPLSPMPTP